MSPGSLAIRILEDYGNEASIEDLIDAISILVDRDKERYRQNTIERFGKIAENDIVLHCLEACHEHLSNASMAWYASTK